jgi:hypothetical protein
MTTDTTADQQKAVLDLLNLGLPKWPQMIVTGHPVTPAQAIEIIRRTDSWFVGAHGCNDRAGDRRLAKRFRMPHFHDYSVKEPDGFDWRDYSDRCDRWKKAWGVVETQYVHNSWIGSAYIHGPHGWCHPNGRISHIDNIGKWPNIDEVLADWRVLAEAFPFLTLTATLMSGEFCEDHARPVVAIDVTDGKAKLVEPPAQFTRPVRGDDMGFAALAVVTMSPASRERYPFSEDVMSAWEAKAIEIDAAIG